MPSESARFPLYDIRDSIYLARDFIKDIAYEDFKDSKLHFYAVTRALEIISEASRRLPEELRAKYPSLPWRAIRSVGNLYRHEYDNVEESYVWITVTEHLEPLLQVVEAELSLKPLAN